MLLAITTSGASSFNRRYNAADARAAAFCSSDWPDPFHAFAYASQVWKPDPFDVDSIHRGAREVLRQVVGRVLQPSGLAVGRILLMLGEAGCGKMNKRSASNHATRLTHGKVSAPSWRTLAACRIDIRVDVPPRL